MGHLVTGAADIPPAKRDCSSYHHLKDIVFDEAEGGVEMIIGAGHAEAWLGGEARMGPTGEPVGISTLLGWSIIGTWGKKDSSCASLNFISTENLDLHRDFQRLIYHDFEVVSEEELGKSQENHHAIRQLSESIHFDQERGKYVVGLPWKGGREYAMSVINKLDSRGMAMKRLRSMVPRFRKDRQKGPCIRRDAKVHRPRVCHSNTR